jgi:hypothetical protein
MSKKFRPKYICRCPFYQKEYRLGICCDGIENDTNLTTMFFDEETKKDAYVRGHCTKVHPDCKLYRLLMEKYEAD